MAHASGGWKKNKIRFLIRSFIATLIASGQIER